MGVYVVTGEAVYRPKKNSKTESTLLFKLRLSHEDVVKSQTTFLQVVEKLRVVEQDIVRLQKLTKGLAPAKLRDRLYEKQILDADINSLGEGLQLHGLSKDQIESIKTNRKLIREILVRLPAVNADGSLAHPSTALGLLPNEKKLIPVQGNPDPPGSNDSSSQPLIVEELNVYKGQLVQAGETLCELIDYSKLYLEGQAFERDSVVIEKAREKKWTVTALLENDKRELEPIQGLQIDYLDNRVDLTSRALRFYARLENKVVGSVNNGKQLRVTWRFKPGQRMQLRVPVEKWRSEERRVGKEWRSRWSPYH